MEKRLLASVALPSKTHEGIEFLAGEFLERLILFDEYILDSIRLQEIPHLVKVFGYAPVLELLESGILKIHSDIFLGITSTGQASKAMPSRARKGDLPLCSYCLHAFSIHPYDSPEEGKSENIKVVQKQHIHKDLQQFHKIDGISFKEAKKLKTAVAHQIVQFSTESFIEEIAEQTYKDVRAQDPAIQIAIAYKIKELFNKEVNPKAIELEIEFIDDDDFRVESNIERRFALNKRQTHEAILRALIGIGRRNHQIAQMNEFKTMVGYRENEVPILEAKFDFLLKQIARDKALAGDFHRILAVKGLPDFSQAVAEGRIDLMKLLELRNSRECVDFRNWIWSQDHINLKELDERLNSFSQQFRDFFRTGRGKIVSWLASAGISSIPVIGGPIGAGLSFYDKFLVKDVLPHKGALTFINNSLPSIYQQHNTRSSKKVE